MLIRAETNIRFARIFAWLHKYSNTKKVFIYVTRFAKTRHNSACINFQYKAIVKLSAKNVFHKKTCSVFIGP